MRSGDREIDRPDRQTGSPDRQEYRGRHHSYRLDENEMRTLRTVGIFRTVNSKDIPKQGVKHLLSSGLMEQKAVYSGKDWKPLDVLVLTREGERVIAGHQPLEEQQRFHSGLVKEKELAHDTAIYPAYLEAAKAIEEAGGKVERVVLDYELKSHINKEMNRGGSVSEEEKDERRAQLAKELDLQIVDGKLPLPDLRIEYVDENGERHHEDIEIVSRHYHGSHLAGKSAAGFTCVSP